MTADRRTSLAAGILFLLTFATSIAAALLYKPVLDAAGAITGTGDETRIYLGAFLELLLIVTNIGTAVVLFPVLRHTSEWAALAYVTARVMECVFIAVGLLALLTLLPLDDALKTPPSEIASSLVSLHDWTFLLGPGWVVGLGNGLLLGYLMYKSNLVPRGLAMFGLVGGPLILLSGTAVLFGAIEPQSPVQGLATVPEFIWEGGLGLYLTFKGFRQQPASGTQPAL